MAKEKGRSKPKHDIKQLESEHNALRPLLAQLDDELHHQLAQLLGQAAVPLGFPIQHRVKTWSSITEKLQRVPLSLSSLRILQDLVGFRIILQFRRDVERVCSLIEQNLKIVERYDTVERLKEDQFGYASVHFVVEVPASWLAVPTMAGLVDLRAEIQVRTTAQHIWAEASQALQYKSKEAVPQALKRSIYRVSALLETVDLEFERVLADREAYRAEVAQTAPTTELLNVDTLAQVLDAIWPGANKAESGEDYADLLADLNSMGVETADALRRLTSKWGEAALAHESATVAESQSNLEQLKHFPAIISERVKRGVYFTHAGLTRMALAKEFPDRWKEHQAKQAERAAARAPSAARD
jgi:putative GTP pyrophosphokinase